MRKIFSITLLILFIFSFFTPAQKALAIRDCIIDYTPKSLTEDSTVELSIQNTEKDHIYSGTILNRDGTKKLYPKTGEDNNQKADEDNHTLFWRVKLSDYGIVPGSYKFKVVDLRIGALNCPGTEFEVKSGNELNCPTYVGTQPSSLTKDDPVTLVFENPPQGELNINVDGNKSFQLLTPNKTVNIGSYPSGSHYFEVKPVTIPPTNTLCYARKYFTITEGSCSATVSPVDYSPGQHGTLKITGSAIEQGKGYSFDFQGCETKCTNAQSSGLLEYQFNINELKCREQGMHDIVIHSEGSSIIGCRLSGPTICTTRLWTNQAYEETSTPQAPPPPCDPDKLTDKGECKEITTALGPLKTDPTGFIKSIFGLLLGVSGGIALLLIIVSGYQLMASQGNPEKVQGAKERLTSAIVGLLFIIFSMVILQVIGVDLLKIPGFQ